ncbi:sugar kinase [Bacillus niameyensis]|uniref:sugar kinase n=1 Tax=Bacillus niameyensis TaxID=1522308 RepID=UPI000781DE59|nr:sugar kinase [Bacillus niameyensis]
MSKKIAAFGEVMMRMQVPGYELLSQANTLNYSFSGTGVNIAAALSHFGHSGYLVSALPSNAIGDAAVSYLRKLGVKTEFVQRSGNYIGIYFLENGFGIRTSRVTYTNRQESSFNTAAQSVYPFEEIAKSVDLMHFCGITLSMNDQVRNQMKVLAKLVKENGGLVVFDCNYRPSLWGENGYEKAKRHYEEMLGFADIVMMNEKDAMFVLGMKTGMIDRKEQLIDLIPKVADRFQVSLIAGTHRTIHDHQSHTLQGFMFKNDDFTFSKIVSFPVLDRIGAGDAFTSGILHGEMGDFLPEQTVDFAVTAAVLAHTIVGDTPLSSEAEVIRAMNENIGDIIR